MPTPDAPLHETSSPPRASADQSSPSLPAPPAKRAALTAGMSQAERSALVVDALKTTKKALDIVGKALADGTADFDDALKALPLLHKIIEHAERIEAQANDTQSQAPLIINFTRAPIPDGFVVDVRRGAKMAELRRRAQAATDAEPTNSI